MDHIFVSRLNPLPSEIYKPLYFLDSSLNIVSYPNFWMEEFGVHAPSLSFDATEFDELFDKIYSLPGGEFVVTDTYQNGRNYFQETIASITILAPATITGIHILSWTFIF